MKMDDFEKITAVWDEMGKDLDLLVPTCAKSDMVNLLMVLHSSRVIGMSSELLSEYFENFNDDINSCFWLMKFFFVAELIDSNKAHFGFSYKGERDLQ